MNVSTIPAHKARRLGIDVRSVNRASAIDPTLSSQRDYLCVNQEGVKVARVKDPGSKTRYFYV